MKEIVMSERDYDYALYRINETLKQEDVENKDGIVSFYDMIKYGKKGLKKTKDIIKDNKDHCFIMVYDSLFFIRLYYNVYGDIKTEIDLLWKYNIEQEFTDKKALKLILEKNKNELLKKFSFDLNKDLTNIGENQLILLAQHQYFKEQVEKQTEKKKVLK